MRNWRKGASNAGADGCRRGPKKPANSGTKDFTSGSRPRARSSASPGFIVNWAARPESRRGPRGAKARGRKTRNARGPRRGSGLKPALLGAAFTPLHYSHGNGVLAENAFRKFVSANQSEYDYPHLTRLHKTGERRRLSPIADHKDSPRHSSRERLSRNLPPASRPSGRSRVHHVDPLGVAGCDPGVCRPGL